MLQEKLRCLIQQRPAGYFSATGNSDQAPFHQSLQDALDRNTADRFDVSTGDRLAVGNDRECDMQNPARRASMANAMGTLARADATRDIVAELLAIAGR